MSVYSYIIYIFSNNNLRSDQGFEWERKVEKKSFSGKNLYCSHNRTSAYCERHWPLDLSAHVKQEQNNKKCIAFL